MATKIKDSATAEQAALKLNEGIEVQVKAGEPQAPREKTTTEKLFPDFMTDDGAIVNRPIRSRTEEPSQVPAPVTPTPAPQGQTPPTQAPTEPVYVSESDLKGKMVKLKVDGIEQDVPASELVKLTQLERHSNAQLMKIAQERAQLERDRQEFLSRPTSTPEPKPTKQEPPVKVNPEIEALNAKISAMEQAMAQERALLQPQIQEAGIKRVEQKIKEATGFDDYRAYHDKVREVAVSEAQKAQMAGDMNAVRFFDSDTYYAQKYQELKLKDLSAKSSAPPVPVTNPQAPVLQTQNGAPVVVNNNGQPVSIPSFESSSGVPSTPSNASDWQATYNTLLTRAKQTPTDENWMAVMRHKFRSE